VDSWREAKLYFVRNCEYVGYWHQSYVNNCEDDYQDERYRHISDQGQSVVDFFKSPRVLDKHKQWGHQEHEYVERRNGSDHSAVLFIILQCANCIYHSIVVKTELNLGESNISLRQNCNHEVKQQDQVHNDDDDVKNDAKSSPDFQFVIDSKVPRS
jgi:hypothetical protein